MRADIPVIKNDVALDHYRLYLGKNYGSVDRVNVDLLPELKKSCSVFYMIPCWLIQQRGNYTRTLKAFKYYESIGCIMQVVQYDGQEYLLYYKKARVRNDN